MSPHPGVIVQTGVTDPAGRTGEAMTVDMVSPTPRDRVTGAALPPPNDTLRFRAIFDPTNSQILANEVIDTTGSTTHVMSQTFLDPGIVTSMR
jgi:hypothetical protein